jgi:hypothetical protein
MTRFISSVYLWLVSTVYAYAQNAPEAAPTTFTEPASAAGVIVFMILFFGSIAVFGFWIWYRSKKQRRH